LFLIFQQLLLILQPFFENFFNFLMAKLKEEKNEICIKIFIVFSIFFPFFLVARHRTPTRIAL